MHIKLLSSIESYNIKQNLVFLQTSGIIKISYFLKEVWCNFFSNSAKKFSLIQTVNVYIYIFLYFVITTYAIYITVSYWFVLITDSGNQLVLISF